MEPWVRYAIALLITIVVELFIACVLYRRQRRRFLSDVPLMNLVTHPLLHVGMGLGLHVVPGELLVIAVEAVIYGRVTGLPPRHAILLSVLANGATWMLGVLPFFA